MTPLAVSLKAVVGKIRYLAVDHISELRKKIGWTDEGAYDWIAVKNDAESYDDFIRREHVVSDGSLLLNIRDDDLINRRAQRGLKTYFSFERWFRPPYGMWRLLYPRFLLMAYRHAQELLRGHFIGLPIGVHAVRDMARLCGLVSGDWRCLLKAPEVCYKHRTGGEILLADGSVGERYGLPNMRMWAYYVNGSFKPNSCMEYKAMWVGRFITCKHVEDIVVACRSVGLPLDLYGAGPQEDAIKDKYEENPELNFFPPLGSSEVREQMRTHSIYIFASDASDGWGVVVNEAMLEGMAVVGTIDAGASATLIENGINGLLYKSGDVKALSALLERLKSEELRRNLSKAAQKTMREFWTPDVAARFLVEKCDE